MSVFGIGIDLCEIKRVETSLQKHGNKFAEKILHQNEMAIFLQKKLQARFLAKRFAAKEAYAKAFGTGIADGVTLPCIEVCNDDRGKPELRLHGKTLTQLQELGNIRVHLSISDERDTAIAQVLIEQLSD